MTDHATRSIPRGLRAVVLVGFTLTTGCFSLARPTPPLEEYVLGATAAPATVATSRPSTGLSIGLRRLDLAPYLATTAIVVQRGSRIETSGFRRWAEDPSASILRAVAAALGSAPSVIAVDIAPWATNTPHDYLVQLHVTHMEGLAADDPMAATGDVRVTTSWEIIRNLDGALVARGESDFHEAGWTVGDYRALVTRVDHGLTALAGDLVACMTELPPIVAAPSAAATSPRVCSRTPAGR